jgi:hypothetical protein
MTEEPIPVQSHTSIPSVISPDLSQQAETSTFPLGSANECACGGELGSINLQSFSPECKGRHSLLKQLGLDRMVNLTPEIKEFYDSIWTAESVL